MRMRHRATGARSEILKQKDVAETLIAAEIVHSFMIRGNDIGNLSRLDFIPIDVPAVFNDQFVSADGIHDIVAAKQSAIEGAFDSENRIAIREGANSPIRGMRSVSESIV